MVVLTKKWIKENADWVSGFGGQYDKERFLNEIGSGNFSAAKGFHSQLTGLGKENMEQGIHTVKSEFLVKGLGWFDFAKDGDDDTSWMGDEEE